MRVKWILDAGCWFLAGSFCAWACSLCVEWAWLRGATGGAMMRALWWGGRKEMGVSDLDRQTGYWDRVAGEKSFTHPLNVERLGARVGREGRVLDYGCGYGRTCAALHAAGFGNCVGVDVSREMVGQGRGLYPHLDLRVLEGDGLPFGDGGFDAVLLFAVLTCVVTDAGQRAVVAEARRVLRPGGLLYVSGYPLQDDERNRRRYEQWAGTYGVYGAFALADGGVVRHMSGEWLAELFGGFEQVGMDALTVSTMNGHPTRIFQYLGVKPIGADQG